MWLTIILPPTGTGEITPELVTWLSSIDIENKNLNGCGKFVLTSDMSELSITKVDLSNMDTLEGKLSCCLIGGEASGPHPKNLPRKLLHLVKMPRNIKG